MRNIVKKAGWPKARRAHSQENRVGQAWKQRIVEKQMEDRKTGKIKVFKIPNGHFRCRCNGIIRLDHRGYAACEKCGQIYNDGPTVVVGRKQKKRDLERFKYDCIYKEG